MSEDEPSFIQRKYAMPNTLNEVKGKPNNTTERVAGGSDFPHVVLLEFSQDMTLGREEVGRSRLTSAPIRHGWSLNQCPVLLDSGAFVPMPFLIPAEALERSCPGLPSTTMDQPPH